MKPGKLSFGIGDRFAHQGEAQLKAFKLAKAKGVNITPVWNKSNREHITIGSVPSGTRKEADSAVKALDWSGEYFVDADHINLSNVDKFIESSDFFTIDVADFIGKKATDKELNEFIDRNRKYSGKLSIPGIDESFNVSPEVLNQIGEKFLFAIKEAGKIYRHIESVKGQGNFVTEISMDEVNDSQSPIEMFFILGCITAEKIPANTIAPKFSGRFNKGVDYQGDLEIFEKEFEQDLLVIDYAIEEFGLDKELKLSVHSGSDKFSIYPVMGRLINKYNKGIHIKTAGTTWLEEVIGLALSGGDALEMAKSIYLQGLDRFDELCEPYATVIDIDRSNLPDADKISGWSGEQFADAIRHEPDHPGFNPDIRQLIHVAYKIAAEYGDKYTSMLKKHKKVISEQVTENIYKRHFGRIFDL